MAPIHDRTFGMPTSQPMFNAGVAFDPLRDRSDGSVRALHDLAVWFDRLKHVDRQNPTTSGSRPENTAEHSWHLAFAVYLFSGHAAEDIDVDHAVVLAVIHDIPEALVGDTFVYGGLVGSRYKRESAALQQLVQQLPDDLGADLLRLWHEYELKTTPEGRFVMALDVLLPVFLNSANVESSSWVRHGVCASQVRERIESVRAACPDLASLADELVDVSEKAGDLK